MQNVSRATTELFYANINSKKCLILEKKTGVLKQEKFAIMHGPLQNRKFGSKIKTLKKMRKMSLEPQQNCFMQNSTPKNK